MKEKVFSKKLHLCIDRIKRSKYEYKELLYLDFTPVYIKYNVIIEISINYKSNVIYRIDNVFHFTDTNKLVKDIIENIKNYLYNNNKYIIKGKYMKLISKNELVLKEENNYVKLSKPDDSALVFAVRVWTKTENYWDLYFDLMESIKKTLDKNKIEIPFPQMDVHINK